MTTLRRTTQWLQRPPDTSLRAQLRGLGFRLAIYGSIGLAGWAHWWYAVRP